MAEEKKVILTREGYQKLEQELNYYISVRRNEISEQIAIARGFGDLSENAEYDEAKTLDDEKEIAVQVNGKLRSTVVVPAGCENSVAVETALADSKVKKFTDGCAIVKTIVVKDKLVNIIVKPSK